MNRATNDSIQPLRRTASPNTVPATYVTALHSSSKDEILKRPVMFDIQNVTVSYNGCLLYTSDAADE